VKVSFWGSFSISTPDLPEIIFKNYIISKIVDHQTLLAGGARDILNFIFSEISNDKREKEDVCLLIMQLKEVNIK